MPSHPKVVNLKTFKGLNNVINPESTPDGYLKRAENIDIDKTGGIKKRKGYSLLNSGNYTSLWASERGTGCFAVRNSDLVRINTDYSITTLKSNVGVGPFSFEEVDDKIYAVSPSYNCTIENGVIRSFGVQENHLAPSLTAITGSLNGGTYQVGFTYIHSNGLESGMIAASSIILQDNSGISFYIPTNSDPDIIYARVYCSTQNGTELYAQGLGLLNSTHVISDQSNLINPLRFFNTYMPPKGHIIKYYRGRVYIADENVLWYSEPFQYEHFKLDSNYIEFPEKIKGIMPVEDGLWIASSSLYYLSGGDPLKFNKSTKENISIVEGSDTKISGSYLVIDNTPAGYKWLVTSDLGIFVLFNQGLTINLTAENLSLTQADKGTSLFLQDSGINQYLSILKTNENPNNSSVGDLVESYIVRNGVIIN